MYKVGKYSKSKVQNVDKFEGEPIEWRIDRILNNNEPVPDETGVIYTEKGDGHRAEFNIRTDRFEVAAEGMDLVQKQATAKSEAKAQKRKQEKEAKIVKLEPKKEEESGAQSTNGTSDSK